MPRLLLLGFAVPQTDYSPSIPSIFTDESGGRDRDLFLVSAVRVEGMVAKRLMRKFRKKYRFQSEIKDDQRTFVFEELEKARKKGLHAVVCHCRKWEMPGSFLFKTNDDAIVWAHLTAEACQPLMGQDDLSGVTVDGGRYTREKTAKELLPLIRRLLPQAANPVYDLQEVDSQNSEGVQLADIIANTVYRTLMDQRDDHDTVCAKLTNQAVTSGFLTVKEGGFADLLPDWYAVQMP